LNDKNYLLTYVLNVQTDVLQRRLRRERKTRRRLELQMRQQHPTSTAPSSDVAPRRYSYLQPHSPGGSTDNDENDSATDRHRHPIRRQQISHDRVLHQPQQQQQQVHQMNDRSLDSTKRASSGRHSFRQNSYEYVINYLNFITVQ